MMTARFLLVATSLIVLVTSCVAQSADLTRQPGSSGSDVVDAVVNIIRANCILSEDRLLLRRLAYVETTDGTDIDTYNDTESGGIWKVSQAMLDATTSCQGVIAVTCAAIQRDFNIDWRQVTMANLSMPLYSGLAATLNLMVQLGSNTPDIPATVQGQQSLWSQYYYGGHPDPSKDFTTLAAAATEYECTDAMDIAFILDGSGSIDDPDFVLSVQFVHDVVAAMEIPNTRVAVIVFESNTTLKFPLNRYTSKSTLLSAISSITRSPGGTATNLALDQARTQVFTTAYGARSNAKRIAVLVTDGQSYSPIATAVSADLLRNVSGVAIFSIGVGGYDLTELHAIANNPKCSYTYTLRDFTSINSILYEIQRSTCGASIPLIPNKDTTIGNGTHTIVAPPDTLVTLTTTCGIAYVYISYTNPNPNQAVYSEMFVSSAGKPVYIAPHGSTTGQPLYMTVVGNEPSLQEALEKNCTHETTIGVTETEIPVMCLVNGECAQCTDEQITHNSRIRDLLPCFDDYQLEFRNPCTPEAMAAGQVLFEYPYDPHKFISCDYDGNPYVTVCPSRLSYNPATFTCGNSGSTTTRYPLPSYYPNPCTADNIHREYLYHPYTRDLGMFIHCDLFGGAWLEHCPVLTVWSQADLTCVADRPHALVTTQAPITIHNPCTPEALAAGHYFHPYPCDHTRYIHCDISGNFVVQFCPAGLFFDPVTSVCGRTEPPGSHGCDA